MAEFPASLPILNGKSTDDLPLCEAIMLLREEGMMTHVWVTWEKGDAVRYVKEVRKLGIATVTAGGGDGIINEVSTALIQCEGGNIPALRILPLGTVNDSATSVGIPEVLDKTLKLAVAGDAIVTDIAQVNKQTCSISMATGGFGTRITTETPEKLKATLGSVSYIIHGLVRMDTLQSDRCKIRGENFHWQGDAPAIGTGSGRQAGGGQQSCLNVLINDGLLQLRILIGDKILLALVSTLKSDEDNPNIIKGASSWFDIQTLRDIIFNPGGGPLSEQNSRIEILPAALRC